MSSRPQRLTQASILRAFVSLTLLTLLFGSGHAVMSAHPKAAPTTNQERRANRAVLDLENPVEGLLRPSEGHTYTLELGEGTLVQLLIEPRGTDLSLSIAGPDGGTLVEIPRVRVARQRRRVVIVTHARGIHLIDLRFAGKTQPEGRFRLTVEPLRDATPRDDIIVRGQQAFIEGERLEEEGRADSLAHALAKYQQARELWRTASHPEGEGQALHHVAEMHRRLGDNRAAMERFREALPLVEAAGDAHWEASTLNGLGAVAVAIGSSLDALEWFRAALPAARRAGDRLAEATVLHSISQALTLLHRFDEAIEGVGRVPKPPGCVTSNSATKAPVNRPAKAVSRSISATQGTVVRPSIVAMNST